MNPDQPLVPGLSYPIPEGAPVDLGERGMSFVRTAPGPSGSQHPPVLLLHGLTAGSGINWGPAFASLQGLAPVVAPDLRGHGRGIKATRGLDLDENAHDAVAILDRLGMTTPVIVVGFSMGGAVAQSIARLHPQRVHGLVLMSTAMRFTIGPLSLYMYGLNPLLARLAHRLPTGTRDSLAARAVSVDDSDYARFIVNETAKHSARGLVHSARALTKFKGADWIDDIAAPAAVLIAKRDRSLNPRVQRKLANALPGATTREIETGHAGVIYEPDTALPMLLDSIEEVRVRGADRS